MLKKLMSLLFEEVDVVEEVSQQEEPVIDLPVSEVEVKSEPEPVVLIKEEEVPQKAKSVFVDSDDDFKEPEVAPKIDKKPIKPSHPSTEYEFSANISPMFGKIPEKEREPILVQSKIELEEEESVLGTIISPIYGITKQKQVKTKVEKPTVVSGSMSLEDILEISEPSEITMEQMTFNEQVVSETAAVEEREDILMQLFKEDEQ